MRTPESDHDHCSSRLDALSIQTLPDSRSRAHASFVTYQVSPPRLGTCSRLRPEIVAIFLAIPDLVCFQAWITAPEDPKGAMLTSPMIGLVDSRTPEARTRVIGDMISEIFPTSDGIEWAQIIQPSKLIEMAERSGFSAVREPGYQDRAFFFRSGLAFAYENAREALAADPAIPHRRTVVPEHPETHGKTCSMVAYRPATDGVNGPAVVQRILDTLSLVLSAEQSDCIISLG